MTEPRDTSQDAFYKAMSDRLEADLAANGEEKLTPEQLKEKVAEQIEALRAAEASSDQLAIDAATWRLTEFDLQAKSFGVDPTYQEVQDQIKDALDRRATTTPAAAPVAAPVAVAAPVVPVTPAPGTPAAPEPAPATPEPGTPATPEATPTPPATPAPENTTARTPEETRLLEERLNESRTKYLKFKKEWEDAQTVKSWFNGQRGRREEIKTKLDQVEAEYLQARAEYVGMEAEKHIAEMAKLEEKELEILYTPQKAGLFKKMAQGWMALGETSPIVDMKNSGRIKKALFNTRSLISYGLLGAGTVLAGPIGWGVAGGAMLMARRGLGGLAAGIGSSELIKSYRQAYLRKDLSQMPSYSEEQYDQVISAMKARGILDGNLKAVINSDEYKQAIEARNNRTRERFESLAPEQRADRASQMIREQQELLNGKIATEKNWNRSALAVGIGVGIFIGSGKAGEMIKGWLMGESAAPARPGMGAASVEVATTEGKGASSAAGSTTEAATTAAAESQPKVFNTVLSVGNRGIEGTLLDLKSSNPSVYQSMIETLKSQDPNFKGDEGGLIHRHIEKFAEGNGYNIGEGGGKDLNWIKPGAEITIDGKGGISIGGIDTMESAPVSVEAPETTPDAPEADDSGDIETQGLTDTTPTPAPNPTLTAAEDTGYSEVAGMYDRTPAPNPTLSPNEILNSGGTRMAGISPAPEAPNVSGAEDSTSSGSETAVNAEKEVRTEKIAEAVSMNKNSDALKSLLSQDEYKEMLRDLSMNERTLNSLPKDMTFEEFGSKYAGDEGFAKKYMRMMDYLQEARNNSSIEIPKSMSMRTVLAVLAESRAK